MVPPNLIQGLDHRQRVKDTQKQQNKVFSTTQFNLLSQKFENYKIQWCIGIPENNVTNITKKYDMTIVKQYLTCKLIKQNKHNYGNSTFITVQIRNIEEIIQM